DFEEQKKQLEKRRENAALEIFNTGGLAEIIRFSKNIKAPWQFGFIFGKICPNELDSSILPSFIDDEQKSLREFSAGFTLGRFSKYLWQWVDSFNFKLWTPNQISHFFTYLPFDSNAWVRVSTILEKDEKLYWRITPCNPIELNKSLDYAIDNFIKNGRPFAA